ncbi:MAG: divalent metal cation transporter [Oscillospiraceae bacterium]|jgi:Mn2+/Fe2+ NRAMP family transporter|nr:divalent metal cation transporter [Oscillospiraceae bacterium]
MSGRKRGPFFLFLFLGPGMLAAMADNDAGGILSYALTGAKFGPAVFVPLAFCLMPVTYTVQEMAMRLGVVAKAGYTRLLRERYGNGWMVCQMAALMIENLLTLLTEFVGMSAGLGLLGVARVPAVLLSAMLTLSVALFSGYRKKERLGLMIGMYTLVFLFLAFAAKSGVGAGESLRLSSGGDFRWYAAALIGNAVAPWMIFYQNSAYADRKMRSRQIRDGRKDVFAGCICQVAVAAALIVVGSSVFGMVPNLESAGPAELVSALSVRIGPAAGILFAVGLFSSGFLAAITVSLSSSFSIAEAFGWSNSLNDSFRDAPGFYMVYGISVLAAAAGVLIPGLPLNFAAVLIQVAGGVLMTPVLIFLTLLTSSRQVMGEYANSQGQKIRAWICVAVLTAVCAFTFFRAAV